ncbi:MAG: hypothetical protein FD123_1623 [Bacteroidetes bacterium]|nr:MAG: hypothetical protein FD123_1623 [Bacteroidota bacterium]
MNTHQPIIPPVDRSLLAAELNEKTFLRHANNGTNEIYVVNAHNSPHTLREIGRVRELTFRASGGGTGLDCDLDDYDTKERCYEQLIVWNPEDKEIVGGYRFIRCEKGRLAGGEYDLVTTELFEFSDRFKNEFLPATIELGRSFVQPMYQPSASNRKGLFSLDNLWDGLGALVIDNDDIRYFYGKVTIYGHYNMLARDLIYRFMEHYFPDPDKLVKPIYPVTAQHNTDAFAKSLQGLAYKDGHRLLNQLVREQDEFIPPLVNSYMNLSATMRSFGTSENKHFGDVFETGILVTIADIYPTKKERHVNSYTPKKK